MNINCNSTAPRNLAFGVTTHCPTTSNSSHAPVPNVSLGDNPKIPQHSKQHQILQQKLDHSSIPMQTNPAPHNQSLEYSTTRLADHLTTASAATIYPLHLWRLFTHIAPTAGTNHCQVVRKLITRSTPDSDWSFAQRPGASVLFSCRHGCGNGRQRVSQLARPARWAAVQRKLMKI